MSGWRRTALIVVGVVAALFVACLIGGVFLRGAHESGLAAMRRLQAEKAATESADRARANPGPSAAPDSSAVAAATDDPVRVVVRDAADRPVAGADVAFFPIVSSEIAFDAEEARAVLDAAPPPPSVGGRTGFDGVAFVRGAARTRWTVVASATGHARGIATLPAPAGTAPRALVIRLLEGHALRGHVFAPGGGPASGVTVVVAPTALSQPWPAAGAVLRTQTDCAGAWRVGELVAGDHQVWTLGASGIQRPAGIVRIPLIEELDVHLVGGGIVAARLVDGDGRPLAGARVRAMTWSDVSLPLGEGVTDAAGRVDIATGEAVCDVLVLQVRAPGGAWILAEALSGLPAEGLADGQRIEVVARARQAMTVHGTVTDADGAPVAGARVQVVVDRWGRRHWDVPDAAVVSDEKGLWRAEGLPGGGVEVRVRRDGYAPGEASYTSMHGEWWPTLRLDVQLERAHPITIHGTVLGPDDAPVAGVDVWCGEGALRVSDRSRADGGFTLATALDDDHVDVFASAPGFALSKDRFTAQDAAAAKVRLETPDVLRGRVFGAGDVPVAGARVAILGGEPSVEAYVLAPDAYRETLTDADGRFAIPQDHPDMEVVWVWSPADGSIEKFRTSQFHEEEMEIRLGESPPVTGLVVFADSGAPAAGLRVCTESWLQAHTLLTRTDAAGRFRLEHAPAIGAHAWKIHIEGDDVEPVEIAPADLGESELRVEVRRIAPIAGRVVREDGTPVVGAEVSCWVAVDSRKATSDADGRFLLRAYVGQDVEIRVELATNALTRVLAPALVSTTPGARDLRVVLDTGRKVTGVVRDARGRPLANATVRVDSNDGTSSSQGEVVTGADGRFVIEGLDGSVHALGVTAADHVFAAPRHVQPGGAPVEVQLEDGLSVTGTLLGPAGPIAGWDVKARSDTLGAQVARTDAEGRFRILGLAPGRYVIVAKPDDNDLQQEQETEAEAGASGVVLRLVARKDDE